MSNLDTLIQDLMIANRILAKEDVVDAYGHVSVRHPENPNRFLIAIGLAGAGRRRRHRRARPRLQPAHSRGHQFVTSYPKASDISSPPCLLGLLPAGVNRPVGLAPTI